MNNKLPYKNMADEVASRGRYGDTTLIHVNPIEVEGLASLVPLTVNPDTGYPEAFLPLLAPFLGTALGTAIGTGAGLSGLALTAAGAGGSALATTAATGSVEEGLMAGLTGFGLGAAMQGAGSALNPGDAAIPTPELAPTSIPQSVPKGGISLPPMSPPTPVGGAFGQTINPITGVASGGSSAKDILGSSEGLKAFGSEALKMKNLVPIASGLGGISVSEDIKRSDANIQRAKDKREREGKEAIANYVENRPGMTQAPFSSQYVPGMQPQGMPQSGTGMKNPYANRYASGGRVRRFKGAGDIQFPPGYEIPGYPGIPVVPPVEPEPDPTPVMPDISQFSMGYDPSTIDFSTGLRKTPEQMQGMVRGRGLTPVPYNYMAGFMPEYQYVSNIQPTSTSIGATGTGTTGATGAEGSYNTPFGTINVGGQNVYKGSYDPDLFAGGTPYNEYLLGNVEKGIPDYLSSYMQNTPYYQYQDQVLGDIYGGGGYGTPGFTGASMMTPPQPQQGVNSQVDALNKRIAELMAQIEGTSTEENTEEKIEEKEEDKDKDKDKKANWVVIDSYKNNDGATVKTLQDTNPNSPTYNQTKQEVDTSSVNKNPKWTESGRVDNGDGTETVTYTDTNPYSDTYGQPKTEIEGTKKDDTDDTEDTDNTDDTDDTTDNTDDTDDTTDNTDDTDDTTVKTDEDDDTTTITDDDDDDDDDVETTPTVTGTTTINTPFGTIEVPLTQELIDAGFNTNQSTSSVSLPTNDQITTVEDVVTQPTLDQEFANKYGLNSASPYGFATFDPTQIRFASGGQIKNSINTLEQYAQPLPMGNISLGNMYAEGGLTETEQVDPPQVEALMQNPVIQEKMSEGDRELLRSASLVVLGRIEDDGSIIERFVEMFGSEALDRLKSELLPDMQQQGLIEGEGGGMDDRVDGVIGDQEKVAVSPGEYIVPADVVGDLGDGNNEQGARIMDDFLSRVRQEKHGTDKQPDPINLDNVMPS